MPTFGSPGRALTQRPSPPDSMTLVSQVKSTLRSAAAQNGGIRARRPIRPMPRPPHSRQSALIDEIAAWEQDRNTHHIKLDWHFTTKDARIKLKHL
jgi:hypothetical protein